MSDGINDFIRNRITTARQEAKVSQRELAEKMGSAQGTVSDIERGRIRVNAADLVRFAGVLGKSVLYFLPGVHQSDQTDREQSLVALFRELDDKWQQSLLEGARNQVSLYKQTKALEAVPPDQQEDAAYDLVLRLLAMQGLKVTRDVKGRPQIATDELTAVLEGKSEQDKLIIEELVQRLEHRGQPRT